MSSDSDLDFESADEDADFDISSKNNNATLNENKVLKVPHDIHVKNEASESIKPVTNNSLEKTIINNDDVQIKEVSNSNSFDDKKSKCSSSSNNIEPKNVENIRMEESEHNLEINSNITEDKTNETSAAEVQSEKQRVTLRLEKKIQKKNLLEKQNSSENKFKQETCENSEKPVEVKQSSWGFSSWSTSLLSTAASSVTTFTSQVSQGIGTVLETVENTLGAPPPEELANVLSERKHIDEPDVDKTQCENSSLDTKLENSEAKGSLLPNVSSWTKVLENTGSKVIMGGLDTLELIGKKTIDIITENDPGLRRTRSVFSDGISLSQILREAKAEADESKDDSESEQIVHYSQMFDEYQGLVHLEALEMLSTQSQAKLQRLLARVPRGSDIRKNIEEIKSICENIPPLDDTTDCESFEDFVTVCKKYVLELNLPFNVESMIKVQERLSDVVKNYENASPITSTPEEIYQSAICSLAEFTAKSIEIFHKLAEIVLIQTKLEPDVEHFATNLTGLTTVLCIEINNLSSRYHHCLDSIAEQIEEESLQRKNITTTVTNLYVEASNSNKYIQDAFLLLVPVLQVFLVESAE